MVAYSGHCCGNGSGWEPPSHLQLDDNSVTFHYEGGRWIRTQLYVTQWPDMTKLLEQVSVQTPIDPRLYEALDSLQQFSDDLTRVHLKVGILGPIWMESGPTMWWLDQQDPGLYQIKMLRLLEDYRDYGLYKIIPYLFYSLVGTTSTRVAIVGTMEANRIQW